MYIVTVDVKSSECGPGFTRRYAVGVENISAAGVDALRFHLDNHPNEPIASFDIREYDPYSGTIQEI
jgi:hypothetical protein